jgi:hypothetical protein
MKVGDLVRWIGSKENPEKNGKIGLIVWTPTSIGTSRFYQILWSDGTINGNIKRQMEVINEAR